MTLKARIAWKRLLLLLGGAAFLWGCVRDDRSECRFPLRLRFAYTYNTEGEDLFDREIEALHLYLYDAEGGRLVAAASPDVGSLSGDHTFEWAVPPGSYRVVAWGGVKQRYDFRSTGNFSEATLSVRRLEDGVSVDQACEHLFHSMAGGVKIDGSVTPEYTLDLHKNSNDVRVVVSGLTDDERTRLRCTIGSANGDYGFDNEVRGVEGVCYLPAAGAEGADAVNEFTVLRLWPGDASRLRVEVAAAGTTTAGTTVAGANGTAAAGATAAGTTATAAEGSQVIFDGSLSELLLQKPGMDLDLQDDFVIKLEAQRKPGGGFGVEIYVDGWHVVDVPGGLG